MNQVIARSLREKLNVRREALLSAIGKVPHSGDLTRLLVEVDRYPLDQIKSR